MIERYFKKLVLLLLIVALAYGVYATRYQHIDGLRYLDRWTGNEIEKSPPDLVRLRGELKDSLDRQQSIFDSLRIYGQFTNRIQEAQQIRRALLARSAQKPDLFWAWREEEIRLNQFQGKLTQLIQAKIAERLPELLQNENTRAAWVRFKSFSWVRTLAAFSSVSFSPEWNSVWESKSYHQLLAMATNTLDSQIIHTVVLDSVIAWYEWLEKNQKTGWDSAKIWLATPKKVRPLTAADVDSR